MNITFPKSEDVIPAFPKVGITLFVSAGVGLLDGGQRGVFCRICVPEIAVPLNNKGARRYQYVNGELPTDDNLLMKLNADSFQNRTSCLFQFGIRGEFSTRKAFQHARIPASVGAVIDFANIRRWAPELYTAYWTDEANLHPATGKRAEMCLEVTSSLYLVNRLAARLADCVQSVHTLLTLQFVMMRSAFIRLLPLHRASRGAKSGRVFVQPVAARERFATGFTGEGSAVQA